MESLLRTLCYVFFELITDLQLLGDTIDDECAIRKFLWVVPPWYAQVVISIKKLVDLSTLSIKELSGQLLTVEECLVEGGKGRRWLLLIEAEWQANHMDGVERSPGRSHLVVGTTTGATAMIMMLMAMGSHHSAMESATTMASQPIGPGSATSHITNGVRKKILCIYKMKS